MMQVCGFHRHYTEECSGDMFFVTVVSLVMILSGRKVRRSPVFAYLATEEIVMDVAFRLALYLLYPVLLVASCS